MAPAASPPLVSFVQSCDSPQSFAYSQGMPGSAESPPSYAGSLHLNESGSSLNRQT